jgi:hypothetical protein
MKLIKTTIMLCAALFLFACNQGNPITDQKVTHNGTDVKNEIFNNKRPDLYERTHC